MKTLDGGRSWIVCGSAFIGHMMTSGFSLAIGVYFMEFLAVFNKSKGTTAWVSALNFGAQCLVGPVASLINHRYGVRVTMFTGGFVSALGLFSCSFATEFYMVLLTFGLITGVGSGFVFNSATVAVSEYFVKYRPLALGLSMTGTGVANITFPWITMVLISEFGWRGALMISSGLVFNVCVGAMLIIKPVNERKLQTLKNTNVKPQGTDKRTIGAKIGTDTHCKKTNNVVEINLLQYTAEVVDKSEKKNMSTTKTENIKQQTIDIICNPNMILTLINSWMFLFGLSVVFTHIAAYAESQGISPSLSRALVSVLGGAGLVGRIGLSGLSQIPCTNTFTLYIVAVALTGMGSILLGTWTSPVGLVISSCVFGFFHTAFGPIGSECIFLVAGPEKFNFAFGYVLIVMGIGWILGAPAAGIVYDVTLHYPNSFYLGGTVMIVAAIVMIPVAVSLRQRATVLVYSH